MIKIKDKSKKQTCLFPKTYKCLDTEYQITFESIEKQFKKSMMVVDLSNVKDYYAFEIDFSDFEDGEYKYVISKDLDDFGLLRIGDVIPSIKRTIIKDKIKQYE